MAKSSTIHFSPLRLISAALISSTLISLPAAAEELADSPARYTGGITLGALGVGASLSGLTDWSLTENDQIQWRTQISGLDADFDDGDDVDLAGIEYKDGDYKIFALQAGLDWYPFATGWAEKIFFASGLMYVDSEFDGNANLKNSVRVGDTRVSPGDIEGLRMNIDNQQLMPYLSLGWGNKLDGERGFDFQAELGIAVPTQDADVSVTADDPGNFLPSSALQQEKQDIEDEIDGVAAFATIAVTYHF